MPNYTANIRDMQFVLHELLNVSGQDVPGYADLERDADLIPVAQQIADQMLREETHTRPALTDIHMDRWFGHAEGFLKT